VRFARDFERDPLLLFQLRGMERRELLEFLRGRAAPAAEPKPEEEDTIEEETVPVRLEPLPADPEAYWAERALPVLPPDAGERRMLDEDVFEKIGPVPFAPNWRALEPQFHRLYDSVYELATLMLKAR
jgi:uncharacterized Zn finger protein